MKNICIWGYCGLAVSALILSPIVVILALPLAIGIGLDVFDMAGPTSIVLALCVPLAIVLLRRIPTGSAVRWTIGYLLARLHTGHMASLIHVA